METEFKLARVETESGPLALVTIDNGEDYTKPTVLGRAALESLTGLLDELEGGDWSGMVLTGKPFIFCAGADINEFHGVDPGRARLGSRVGHELFARIAALPFPTLAAINGACLGGGLELALHCDYRSISTAVRHFGCPEVFLGLFPAWGGTQLVPRLAGVDAAIRVVVTNPMRQNRLLTGAEAHELGLADALLEPTEFLDESIALLLNGVRPRKEKDLSDEAEAVAKARRQLDDSLHGAAPAPYKALELIQGAASGWSLEEGYAAEEEAIAELLPSRQAQASLYAFDLVERRAKRNPGRPDAESRKIANVGIVGAGLMATQLATLFLRRLEVPIAIRDLDQEIVDRALAGIQAELESLVQKGRYDEGKARFLASLVTGGTGYDHFADCDFVLEAVFEEMGVKKEVFAELEAVVPPECVLATNTSALLVTEMGANLEHPERLVGLHFFNPVAVLPLVEIIRTPETDDTTLATVWDVAAQLRKRPVLVKDAPAFVVNRVLTRMTVALMDALEQGNTVEETDEAILRLGMPMAPSVLLQMVGPRVANHVLQTLNEAYPDRFPLSETLANYADGKDEIAVRGDARRSVEEIQQVVLEAIADEIRHLLDEGVVGSAKDVDTALLLGAGWPFFLGGITKYLDQSGISQRVAGQALAETSAEFGYTASTALAGD
ncbi:MAG TPA: 3-hydroxyacyl-CoA dehydrogenase NAD-binding domain-containing protein [Gaiellaceae bacterium]|nr:3-hydroxyacyl-CoA dehydrogenase NAD-binding domain-containing protein [Gaiellaceae bacterium]